MNANLSIIIATFNSDKTLQKTLESLVNQTYKGFEIIIVDGLSKDNTVSIIKEYEKKFEALDISYNWSSENDSGIYDAWNKALERVSTSWIAFLGSDDTYYPDALEVYNDAITKNPGINYISGKVELIDTNDKVLKIIGKPYKYKQMKRYMDIAHVGSFHHKELFKKHGSFNLGYKVVADYDFFLKCGNDIQAAYINGITAKMLNAGVSNQNVSKVFKEVLKVHLAHKQISKAQAYFEYLYNHFRIYASLLIGKTSFKT
jgi:glycosyltransferase involved in cell wall biosynthesis